MCASVRVCTRARVRVYVRACVCARVCARARVRACVCVCFTTSDLRGCTLTPIQAHPRPEAGVPRPGRPPGRERRERRASGAERALARIGIGASSPDETKPGRGQSRIGTSPGSLRSRGSRGRVGRRGRRRALRNALRAFRKALKRIVPFLGPPERQIVFAIFGPRGRQKTIQDENRPQGSRRDIRGPTLRSNCNVGGEGLPLGQCQRVSPL